MANAELEDNSQLQRSTFNVQLQKRRASSMMWEQLASAVTLVEPFHKLSIVLSPQSSDSSIMEKTSTSFWWEPSRRILKGESTLLGLEAAQTHETSKLWRSSHADFVKLN
jgi:hypothetical protein